MLKLLRVAAEVAIAGKDPNRNFYLGAVGIRRDQVQVRSANGAAYFRHGPAHAEARILRKTGLGAVIYVARIARVDGKLALARPCNRCWSLMVSHDVEKCFYTIDENEYGIITFGNGKFTERTKILNGKII